METRSPGITEIRRAEIIAALSMATDLAMGQPMENALRSCVLARRLGEALGFGRADMLASFALFDDNPALINNIEAEFHKITPELVQRTAAEYLRPENRTVLVLETKPADAAETKGGN